MQFTNNKPAFSSFNNDERKVPHKQSLLNMINHSLLHLKRIFHKFVMIQIFL